MLSMRPDLPRTMEPEVEFASNGQSRSTIRRRPKIQQRKKAALSDGRCSVCVHQGFLWSGRNRLLVSLSHGVFAGTSSQDSMVLDDLDVVGRKLCKSDTHNRGRASKKRQHGSIHSHVPKMLPGTATSTGIQSPRTIRFGWTQRHRMPSNSILLVDLRLCIESAMVPRKWQVAARKTPM